MSKKLISYVFPVYNEGLNLEKLYSDLLPELDKVKDKYDFEIVCINDGSKDNSFEKLIELHNRDKRFKIINFSRNFGHQIAVTAGLDYAKGDAVIIMDSDLQDPPRVSIEMLEKWQEGYEVVYGQRRTRKDTIFKRFTAFVFYRTLDKVADIKIPKDTGDFRLMDKKVVDTIKKFGERNRFLRGMVAYVGFKQYALMFDRDERHAGVTNYPLRKMLKLAFDGILSFSTAPLQFVRKVGMWMFITGIFFNTFVVVDLIRVRGYHLSSWFIVLSVGLLISGIQTLMLSIVSIYVGRIYAEALNRPLYMISSITE